MEVVDELRHYLCTEVIVESGSTLLASETNVNLISEGVIDSLAIMKLVSFMESHWGVTISDADITPENFATLDSLAALVNRRRLKGSGS